MHQKRILLPFLSMKDNASSFRVLCRDIFCSGGIHPIQRATEAGQRSTPRRGRAAFTLVELLVVIAIIGILAGLLLTQTSFVRKKAYATRTSELISQVRTAWKTHQNSFRSFPDPKLFSDKVESASDNDDIAFYMTPHNLCLLNWRCERPTDFLGDQDAWMKALEAAIKEAVNDSANANNKPDSIKVVGKSRKTGKNAEFTVSTRDAFLEINQIQWICGILNDWGTQKARALYKQGGASSAQTVRQVLKDEDYGDPLVIVKLDTGYDGHLSTPSTTGSTFSGTLNDPVAVWVGGASKKDADFVSW